MWKAAARRTFGAKRTTLVEALRREVSGGRNLRGIITEGERGPGPPGIAITLDEAFAEG